MPRHVTKARSCIDERRHIFSGGRGRGGGSGPQTVLLKPFRSSSLISDTRQSVAYWSATDEPCLEDACIATVSLTQDVISSLAWQYWITERNIHTYLPAYKLNLLELQLTNSWTRRFHSGNTKPEPQLLDFTSNVTTSPRFSLMLSFHFIIHFIHSSLVLTSIKVDGN